MRSTMQGNDEIRIENNKIEYKAPALEKGLDILELLADQQEALSKKEIAERLDRNVNEIFRMLVVLRTRGYVVVDEKTGLYNLSLKLFELSNQHPIQKRLLEAAAPLLERMCAKIQQSCHISAYYDGRMLVIAQHDSPYKMGFGLRIGARIDICGSGSGIVLLAHSSKEDQKIMLQRSNASAKEQSEVLKELPETLKQGYHIGPSSQVSGITNISYPILSIQKKIIAVITIPFLTLNTDTVHHHVTSIEASRVELEEVTRLLTQAIGGEVAF